MINNSGVHLGSVRVPVNVLAGNFESYPYTIAKV